MKSGGLHIAYSSRFKRPKPFFVTGKPRPVVLTGRSAPPVHRPPLQVNPETGEIGWTYSSLEDELFDLGLVGIQ